MNNDFREGLFSSASSVDNAIVVAKVRQEYEYLRHLLGKYSYQVKNVVTREIDGRTYDILTVEDVERERLYDFYFDATSAMENASANMDELLRERKEKDRKAVLAWLESNGHQDTEDV